MVKFLHIPTNQVVQLLGYRDVDRLQGLFPDGEVQTLPAKEFQRIIPAPEPKKKPVAKKEPEIKQPVDDDVLIANDDGTFA